MRGQITMKIFECLFETHKKVKLLENEIKELKDQLKEQSENFSEILKITRDTNEKLYRCDWEPSRIFVRNYMKLLVWKRHHTYQKKWNL